MSSFRFGTTGKILRVDLSSGKTWAENLEEEKLLKYVGGTSLGTKYVYDEVPPTIHWSDPKNLIYIGSGPLGGTRIAGSGSFSVVTKGALTNGVASSQANGYLGAYLKSSGYDGILIHGCSDEWKYLFVSGSKIELKDGKHLIGLDTWSLEDKIRENFGASGDQLSVCGIGPAGENLVRFAGIFSDRGHSASHNGVGAVLGSKKLKGIAVARDKKELGVAHPDDLSSTAKELVKKFRAAAGGLIFETGTSKLISAYENSGILPVKNYTTNIFSEASNFYTRDRFKLTRRPCWRCPSSHVMHIEIEEGRYAGFYGKDPEYEQEAGYGPQIGNSDLDAMIVLANEGDRLGFDANECCWIIGWVMECFEKGLILSKDIDGLEMTWGNVEAVLKLMNNIAYRKGFGSVLAEGIKDAAVSVGGQAVEMAIYTGKGNTPRMHDHRSKWWEMLDTCVSESATLQNQLLMLDLKAYGIKAPFEQYSWQSVAEAVGRTSGTLTFVDSLVLCFFTCSGDLGLLARALNASTGWGFTFDECLKVGRRAINLMRLYNLQCGLIPNREYPSARYGSVPADGPAEGMDISSNWDKMRRRYYELMGWDKATGLPRRQTLINLGLDELVANSY